MGTHTPGPWHYIGTTLGEDSGWFVRVAPHRHVSAEGRSGEEAEANARLIAAAPELLEALRKLSAKGKAFRNTVVETRGVIGMDEHDIAIAAADAAIAKATGAEP